MVKPFDQADVYPALVTLAAVKIQEKVSDAMIDFGLIQLGVFVKHMRERIIKDAHESLL